MKLYIRDLLPTAKHDGISPTERAMAFFSERIRSGRFELTPSMKQAAAEMLDCGAVKPETWAQVLREELRL